MNSDPDSANVPMINFCDEFLVRRSLSDGITYGKGLNNPGNLQLSNYDNRAQTFFYELFHIDLAADSPTPNPAVDDLTIQIRLRDTGRTFTSVAYGPFMAKTLARWQRSDFKVGHCVQRNAYNLAYYALAKYVIGENKIIYPHLPIVSRELLGPPYKGLLADFDTDGTNVYLDTTDDAAKERLHLGSASTSPYYNQALRTYRTPGHLPHSSYELIPSLSSGEYKLWFGPTK